MNAKKGLQKFTDTDEKLNRILSLEQINPSDIESLSQSEKECLFELLTEKFNKLKGEERDKFYKKCEPVTSEVTKNQLWESNHIQITQAISSFMQEYGRMPTRQEIANKTELSRQTIHKHLKEYTNHPQYLMQIEQFRFMTSKVLAKVFQFAVKGDTAAAKLYFNVMGCLSKGQSANNTLIQNQNNYMQINGTVLSQEIIKNLTTEQLNTIESILKAALQQPETVKTK